MGKSPEATIIIPCLNAAETLGVQLRALSEQVSPPNFEVIVADNGSRDGTADVARSFASKLRIRIVDASSGTGPAVARNRGAQCASTHKLLFCDADDRVGPRWLSSLSRKLEVRPLATGPVIYVDDVETVDTESAELTSRQTQPRMFLEQVPFAPSCNLAIRADLLRRLGGFDESLQCAEDTDLTIRAQANGAELAWEEQATVFYARRASLRATARQFFRYGYFEVLVYRRLRGEVLCARRPWPMIRPYMVLAVTLHRLLTPASRRVWVTNAAHHLGRVAGSIRFRTLCP